MQSVSTTDLYDLLSQKLGKEEAKTLVAFVEAKIDEDIDKKIDHLATKEDLLAFKQDLLSVKRDLSESILEVKHSLSEDLTKAISGTNNAISDTKSDLLKWMFGIFVALTIMILGLYATVIFR